MSILLPAILVSVVSLFSEVFISSNGFSGAHTLEHTIKNTEIGNIIETMSERPGGNNSVEANPYIGAVITTPSKPRPIPTPQNLIFFIFSLTPAI